MPPNLELILRAEIPIPYEVMPRTEGRVNASGNKMLGFGLENGQLKIGSVEKNGEKLKGNLRRWKIEEMATLLVDKYSRTAASGCF